MPADQLEIEGPPIVDVDGPRLDRRGRRGRLAGPGAVDVDHPRQAAGDVQVEVDPDAGAGLAARGRVADGPGDVGGQGQEGAVDGQHPADRVGEVRRGLQAAPVDLLKHMVHDGPQDGRVDEAVEVGQGALGEAIDGEIPLGLAGAAEVLQGAERAEGGVEEGQEMGDEDVAGLEGPVGVVGEGGQLLEQGQQAADGLAADDHLRPFGPVPRLLARHADRTPCDWPADILGPPSYLKSRTALRNGVVHVHLKNILPESPRPDAPVFLGGGARPNARFQRLSARSPASGRGWTSRPAGRSPGS